MTLNSKLKLVQTSMIFPASSAIIPLILTQNATLLSKILLILIVAGACACFFLSGWTFYTERTILWGAHKMWFLCLLVNMLFSAFIVCSLIMINIYWCAFVKIYTDIVF